MLLGFAAFVLVVCLGHQIRMAKQKRKNIATIMKYLANMKASGDQTQKAHVLASALASRIDSRKVVNFTEYVNDDYLQSKLQGMVTSYLVEEVEEILSDRSTPVCKPKKGKQIRFPKKKKGAN